MTRARAAPSWRRCSATPTCACGRRRSSSWRERGTASLPAASSTTASESDNQLARIHAIWGLGQIGSPDSAGRSAPLVTAAGGQGRRDPRAGGQGARRASVSPPATGRADQAARRIRTRASATSRRSRSGKLKAARRRRAADRDAGRERQQGRLSPPRRRDGAGRTAPTRAALLAAAEHPSVAGAAGRRAGAAAAEDRRRSRRSWRTPIPRSCSKPPARSTTCRSRTRCRSWRSCSSVPRRRRRRARRRARRSPSRWRCAR